MKNWVKSLLCMTILCLTSACSSDRWFGEPEDPPLPGERISVLEFQKELETTDIAFDAQGFIVSDAWPNNYWPQAGGYPNHSMQHLSLRQPPLKRVWSTDIGAGVDNNLPLITQPIIANDMIYTVDSHNRLTAFSTKNGKEIWRMFLSNKKLDDNERVVSGAIGYSGGVIYATTGSNRVAALNALNGSLLWSKDLLNPTRSAPTILDGRVYVLTLDNRLIALNAEDGSILWEHEGFSESAGILSNTSPAADNNIVVVGYSSGAIFGLRAENGSVAWQDNIGSLRNAVSFSKISDISALPVIDRGLVFAVSSGGKLVAIDARNGVRVWQREISSTHTPWVAGNYVFVLTNENKLVALGRENGAYAWVTPLKRYKKEKKKRGPIRWTTPMLASGNLYLFNSIGEAITVNPETGTINSQWKIEKHVNINPIIAQNRLYLLSDNGKLSAYE